MKLQTKKIICLLIAIASVMTIIGTVSYAYFTAMADVREQSAVLTSGTMRVKFNDNDTGLSAELNFGESATKRFTIENTGTLDASVFMYWEDLINTYTKGSLTYTLSQSETEDGTYTEIVSKTNVPVSKTTSRKNLSSRITIPAGKTYYYSLVITLNYLEDVNQDADITAKFSTKFNMGNEKIETIVDKIIASSNGERTSFDDPAKTDEGIFEMEDDYGTSYYYRGAVENNYVKFGKWNDDSYVYIGYYSSTNSNSRIYYTLEECQNASSFNYNCTKVSRADQDMYWRIIRINGDGSMRIIYDGTEPYSNGKNTNDRFVYSGVKFNLNNNDNRYMGYMYGDKSSTQEEAQENKNSSNIKNILDDWYVSNFQDTIYEEALVDNIFCGDRTTPGSTATGWVSDTGLGTGKNFTAYGSLSRIGYGTNIKASPTFKCPQKNDAFTVSDTSQGNGALTYPIGLITADEVVAAGTGKDLVANESYYLYNQNTFSWTISPGMFGMNGNPYIYMTILGINGSITPNTIVSSLGGLKPVINLSLEYVSTMIGSGTMTDPYRVE